MAFDRADKVVSVPDLTIAAWHVQVFPVVLRVRATSIAHAWRVPWWLANAQTLHILQPMGRSWS